MPVLAEQRPRQGAGEMEASSGEGARGQSWVPTATQSAPSPLMTNLTLTQVVALPQASAELLPVPLAAPLRGGPEVDLRFPLSVAALAFRLPALMGEANPSARSLVEPGYGPPGRTPLPEPVSATSNRR
jgi:hypothetical protein